MKKPIRLLFLLAVIGALVFLGISSVVPTGVSAGNGRVLSAFPVSETWNMGITVEGPPAYQAVIGRSLGASGAFRSNRGVNEISMIFPAPATVRTVQSASFFLVSRSGSYTGTALLSLRIYDYAGSLVHTVSAVSYDLESTVPGQWVSVDLSSTPEDLIISPGEFLAFHFALSAGPGNDLDVRPVFDVAIQ